MKSSEAMGNIAAGVVAPRKVDDGYARQIAWLRENPDTTLEQWRNGVGIFQFVESRNHRISRCGCLVMIREYDDITRATTDALTYAINSDDQLPKSIHEMSPNHFDHMAEWNRRIDRELGREPFVFTEEGM